MKNNFLLKKKVLLLLVVVGIFSIFIVGIFVFTYASRVLVENKKEAIFSSSLEQMHSSAMIFKNNELFVHMLSTRTRVREYLLDKSKTRETELTGIY